ncbi:MAG: YfaZ family outer membrane protein, partial [Povalibacter sp.]
MRAPLFAFLMLLSAASVTQAQETAIPTRPMGEVSLSNDTAQLRYISNGDAVGVSQSRFMGSFLLSEQRDVVLSAAVLFPTGLDLGRLSVTFGPQVYAALLQDENSDVMAVSVGTQLRFLLNRNLGLAISGEAFYAPDILTFGSADNLTDLSARVEIAAASKVTAFAGMRWFEFDLTEG